MPVIVMSNLNHQVQPDAEKLLKDNPRQYAGHSAWNFFGYVKWDPDWELFFEEVHQYHQFVGTYAAETLEELMELTSDKYGWQ